uniref:Ribosomal protein L6 n=1 Tax=Schizymenia dubyi TaxID=38368 RepID=A0A1C9C9K9_9FLOR|nr:ribosomal protein L6 [Schizymenia dubyi]AOM65073.1 ribosomal protein L6 [Schizymenia dubyi]
MSRIGKQIINLSDQIITEINGKKVSIIGPKGKLSYHLSNLIDIKESDNKIQLKAINSSKEAKALYGLSRTIINNMVIGVSQGFEKKLEIQGVGYRSQMQGDNLILYVGYSHEVIIKPPENVKIIVENNTNITIHGINKEIVGQIAAKIRAVRPPEPYKGKGIRYQNENIRRKIGKAGK